LGARRLSVENVYGGISAVPFLHHVSYAWWNSQIFFQKWRTTNPKINFIRNTWDISGRNLKI